MAYFKEFFIIFPLPFTVDIVNDGHLARFLQGLKNSLADIENFAVKRQVLFGHHQRQQLISPPSRRLSASEMKVCRVSQRAGRDVDFGVLSAFAMSDGLHKALHPLLLIVP